MGADGWPLHAGETGGEGETRGSVKGQAEVRQGNGSDWKSADVR